MIALLLDGLVAVLLVATLGYCFLLNRRLAALRSTQDELQNLIKDFDRATEAARAGVADLKAASEQAGAELQEHIGKGRALADELTFITDAGARLADRVASNSAGRKPAESTRIVAKRKPEARSDARGGEEPRSEAERELLNALRRVN